MCHFRDVDQSSSDSLSYHFDMAALCGHLKTQGEENKTASYFNIDILKYQVIILQILFLIYFRNQDVLSFDNKYTARIGKKFIKSLQDSNKIFSVNCIKMSTVGLGLLIDKPLLMSAIKNPLT